MAERLFHAGVNLGGWISQYWKKSKEHFDSFITEDGIERIASWGMDHVRLPVDYPVFEEDDQPGEYKEEGLNYIDQCIQWCMKRDLGIILDLHKAPGYSFGTLESNNLFDDEGQQQRYINIWKMFSNRYRSEDERLQLELLNEVVEETSDRWNRLAHRTIAAMREVDSNRKIIFGGNHYNSVDQLKNIDVVQGDNNIIYTFHFYKPHMFTHQNASWVPHFRKYGGQIEYPGEVKGLDEFLDRHPEISRDNNEIVHVVNRELLEGYLEPAIEFSQQTGKPLYCGEYGVIDHASIEARINWHRDLLDLFNELQIGRSVWSYKEMNIGLVNLNGKIVSQELIDLVSKK